MVPSFLIDPTMIWLDFEGPGLPESRKISKTTLLEMSGFFSSETILPGPVFLDFGSHFGVSFGASARQKITEMFFFFGLFLWRGPF